MFWVMQAPAVSGQPQAACDEPRFVATSFLPAAAQIGFPESLGSGYCLKWVHGGRGGWHRLMLGQISSLPTTSSPGQSSFSHPR